MKVRITTLIENNPDTDHELSNEHGLSLYIEVEDKKILFDTGQTGLFVENAKKLGKNLSDLDHIVISHGHYDHSGGVQRLTNELEEMPELAWLPEFLVGSEFFEPKYKRLDDLSYKYNGNPFDDSFITDHRIPCIKVSEDSYYISEDIMLFHHFQKKNDFELSNHKFCIIKGDEIRQDEFMDEIALVIKTLKGLIVIVGCSHVGIVNILSTIIERTGMSVYALIGGTHLIEADENRMMETIDYLNKINLGIIAVSHCTGEHHIARIKQEFGDRFVYNTTGNIIEVVTADSDKHI
ncbi:MAG: MBL fold metallo-hydrolase [Lachnospiraceae bacterium]|nr:MBL fold metallo-hydrolase [Lachnospiraceae bacterium]